MIFRNLSLVLVLVLLGGLFWSGRNVCPAQEPGGSLAAAENLLSQFDPEKRKAAFQPFENPKRTDWHYFPREREGVAVGDMTDEARQTLWDLVGCSLSDKGVAHAKGVLILEEVLYAQEQSESRNPGNYHLVFWGEPAEKGHWGWRFEGHHLSINATFGGNRLVSITPTFIGANPAEVATGPRAGFRNLPEQEDLAREFMLSLGKEKRVKAIQPGDRGDIEGAQTASIDPPLDIGLPASELSQTQKELFKELLQSYLGFFTTRSLAAIGLTLDRVLEDPKLVFQWWGGLSPGEVHAYRICGETIDIQYANRAPNANHIHTVVRIPGEDFGL